MILNFLKYKKIVLVVLAIILVFFIGNIKAVHAGWFSIEGVASAAIGAVVYSIGFILGSITSAVFWIGGLLVDFSLSINGEILSSTNAVVHSGWNIVLSFANLGFVLAIIVIAFATILRRESYGMNQILWKLIVAALLVNFSLVIAGAFISVSDTVSNIFLNKATLKGPGSFSVVLGSALGVQTFLDVKSSEDSLSGAVDVFGKSLLMLITSILFIAAFNFVGGLTLFALATMLLIRYVALSILLIISPIVWLLWIFPSTQKYWKEWWDNFMRWTFFSPIVLFFLYLTVSTLKGMKNFADAGIVGSKAVGAGSSSPFTFGVDTVGKFVTVIGLMIGGLIAANKMSITGAGAFYGMAQNAGKAVGGLALRKGKQYGTGWLNKKREVAPGVEKSYADRLAQWSATSKLAKYTVLPGLAARGIAKFSAAGGENLVKDAKGAASKRSLNENVAMLGYADAPNRQGILQHLQEKDLLDKVPDMSKYISKGYKAEAVRFGQSVGYNNIEKSLGTNVEMKEAFDKFGKDSKQFHDAGEKFFSKFSEKDWAKPQYNEIYSSKPSHGVSEELHTARQEVFAYAVGEINPGQLAKTMPKIKGANFDNYEKAVNKAVTEMYKTNPEKAEKVTESFKKALGRRMLGIEWESMEPAETTEPKEEKKEDKK